MQNSFNLAEAPQLYDYSGGTYITQAVAARIFGDRSAFFDCGFMGFQDTLWDVQGRHLFENCYIEGAIDFIFGRGQSIYKVLYKLSKLMQEGHSWFCFCQLQMPIPFLYSIWGDLHCNLKPKMHVFDNAGLLDKC